MVGTNVAQLFRRSDTYETGISFEGRRSFAARRRCRQEAHGRGSKAAERLRKAAIGNRPLELDQRRTTRLAPRPAESCSWPARESQSVECLGG
jgi:hypothetical protein